MGRNISGLLSKQKHIPDIICLQETCFRYEKDHPDIAGFILANFSARNIKRGGTATL
jgi:exonuclease III